MKALDIGNKSARNSINLCYWTLGRKYKIGDGVNKDLNETYAYYKLAAVSNPDLRHYIETLEKDMTPEQIEAGERRSKEIQVEFESK